jgi:carbon starvation protein
LPAVVVALVVFVAFYLGYRYYSRYLAEKVYALDKSYRTPAHEFEDGVDYVPTNKHVLFGHHFTSVAGAAPIVGPAIAVFWGGCRRFCGWRWEPSSRPGYTISGRWWSR